MGGLRVLRSATVAASLAAVASLAVTSAATAGPTPPLTELKQAQSHISALVSEGDTKAKVALRAAVADLAEATAESEPPPAFSGLWIDASDALPPPYGETVFTSAAAAVKELKRLGHDHTVPAGALSAAKSEIVEAEEDLAGVAAREVQGFRARPGRPEKKWLRAFGELAKQITDAVTSVPSTTLEQAATAYLEREPPGPEFISEHVQPVTGLPPLTDEGKPEVFYYGSEGCPFCAIERWSLLAALARFGEFSALAPAVSSTLDIFPATHTVSFDKATYTSSYVAFVPDEAYTTLWTPLQEPTPSEVELLEARHVEFFPFVDYANKWENGGSSFPSPEVVAHKSWQEIAAAMGKPSSTVGQEIDFDAELVTAQICDVDGEQPVSVCDTGLVHGFKEAL
jgi:hypothetical protein